MLTRAVTTAVAGIGRTTPATAYHTRCSPTGTGGKVYHTNLGTSDSMSPTSPYTYTSPQPPPLSWPPAPPSRAAARRRTRRRSGGGRRGRRRRGRRRGRTQSGGRGAGCGGRGHGAGGERWGRGVRDCRGWGSGELHAPPFGGGAAVFSRHVEGRGPLDRTGPEHPGPSSPAPWSLPPAVDAPSTTPPSPVLSSAPYVPPPSRPPVRHLDDLPEAPHRPLAGHLLRPVLVLALEAATGLARGGNTGSAPNLRGSGGGAEGRAAGRSGAALMCQGAWLCMAADTRVCKRVPNGALSLESGRRRCRQLAGDHMPRCTCCVA